MGLLDLFVWGFYSFAVLGICPRASYFLYSATELSPDQYFVFEVTIIPSGDIHQQIMYFRGFKYKLNTEHALSCFKLLKIYILVEIVNRLDIQNISPR